MSVSRIARGMRLFEEYVGARAAAGQPVKESKGAWSSAPSWVRDVWIQVGAVDVSDEAADLRTRLVKIQGERDECQRKLGDSEEKRVKLRSDLDTARQALAEAQKQAAMSGRALAAVTDRAAEPIAMHLWCPSCGTQHLDVGEFATRPHKTHTCQSCGFCWMPCLQPTCGVQFLPGTKNPTARTWTREDFIMNPCPTCDAKPNEECARYRAGRDCGPMTTGDHGPEWHEQRRPK